MTDLYQKAHQLGDEYYDLVTRTLCTGNSPTEACLDKAHEYLAALTELKDHLQNQQPVPVAVLKQTLGYIDLVNNDIAAHGIGLKKVTRILPTTNRKTVQPEK